MDVEVDSHTAGPRGGVFALEWLQGVKKLTTELFYNEKSPVYIARWGGTFGGSKGQVPGPILSPGAPSGASS